MDICIVERLINHMNSVRKKNFIPVKSIKATADNLYPIQNGKVVQNERKIQQNLQHHPILPQFCAKPKPRQHPSMNDLPKRTKGRCFRTQK